VFKDAPKPAAKADQAAVKVRAAALVEGQLVGLAIEFETPRHHPVGVASSEGAQVALIGAVAGNIPITQDHAPRSAMADRDLKIAYDGAAIEN
jgi:hypothetical protein